MGRGTFTAAGSSMPCPLGSSMTIRILTELSPAETERAIRIHLRPWLTHDFHKGAFVGRCRGGRVRIWHSKFRWNLPNMVFAGRIHSYSSGALLEGRFELPRHLKFWPILIVVIWAFVSLRGIPSALQGQPPALPAVALLLLWAIVSVFLFLVLRAVYRLILGLSNDQQQFLKHQLVTWVEKAAA
jgi:hypothetical protein